MAFRLSRGPRSQGDGSPDRRPWTEDELIWGVPRRAGHDDHDDPKAHAGLAQHAFVPGNDERAICGFEPAKRASAPSAKPRPQLATPSPRLNPRCNKCVRLIARAAQPVPEPAALPAEPQGETPAEQPAEPAPTATATPPATDLPPAALNPPTAPILPLPAAPPAPPTAHLAPPPVPPPALGDGWAGTIIFAVGDSVATVRPPSQSGMGVVASVVSGPSGTRVASVVVNDDGRAVISLAEPAHAPVTVAWFVVPTVDGGSSPHVPPT